MTDQTQTIPSAIANDPAFAVIRGALLTLLDTVKAKHHARILREIEERARLADRQNIAHLPAERRSMTCLRAAARQIAHANRHYTVDA